MGDLVEFDTRLHCENVFYKITSGAVTFAVKGEGDAVIHLYAKPFSDFRYSIVIGDRAFCEVKKDIRSIQRKSSHDILLKDVFTEFWLTWSNNNLRLGKYNETKPILNIPIRENDINYVLFTSGVPSIDIRWKVLLPPVIEKPIVKKLTGGEPQWIAATDQLPDGAVIGGHEKETLYIIRAPHRQSLTPGKFVPSEGVGYIPWGGEAHEKNEFEVLCGYNCVWEPTSTDKIPAGAVEAGHSETYEGGKLFVGRAEMDGHLIPGKVQPTHRVCYIAYDGREVAKDNYEILVVPHTVTAHRQTAEWFYGHAIQYEDYHGLDYNDESE